MHFGCTNNIFVDCKAVVLYFLCNVGENNIGPSSLFLEKAIYKETLIAIAFKFKRERGKRENFRESNKEKKLGAINQAQ